MFDSGGQDVTAKDLRLGDHRVVLAGMRANLIFTSPPYNIGFKAPRRDGNRRNGYDPVSFSGITGYADSLPEDEYQRQQAGFLIWCADHLQKNGTLIYNHKPRQRKKTIIDPHAWILRPEVRARLVEATYPVIWDRGSTHNNGRGQIHAQTERLYVLRRAEDTAWRMNNHRSRHLEPWMQTDIWRVPLGVFEKRAHCAPFSLALAEAVVRLWSEPGDLVMDPFAGSGTTGVAAIQAGRRFAGAEIKPEYASLAQSNISAALAEVAA